MRQNKDYLITEKPSRALLIFSIPMIIGNLFQQAYTIVDWVWLVQHMQRLLLREFQQCYL